MKNLEAIKLKLDEMLAGNNEQLADIESQLEEARQAEAEAKADMEAAAESVDSAKYKKAAGESRAAQDLITMLKAKRGSLKNPLIDEREYRAITGEIIKVLDRINRENRKKAGGYAQKLLDIKDDTDKAIVHGNALLHQLQVDVYKEKSKLPNTEFLHPTEQLRYKNYGLLQIIGQMEGDINWLKGGSNNE